MKESFDYVLNNYVGVGKVDSTTQVYKEIIDNLPNQLKARINDDKYDSYGSVGQGFLSEVPFVAMMDTNITDSTQTGLYMVYLFKKDLSGFYLSLLQGIVNFDNLYKADRYKNARKVAKYFKDEITSDYFSKGEIDLGKSKNNKLSKGYEATNIISKFYEKGNYTEEELNSDLFEMKKIYDEIIQHMESTSYETIINDVLSEDNDILMDASLASEKIKKFIDPYNSLPYGFRRKLNEVNFTVKRSEKFKRLTNPRLNKIDYIEKSYRDQKTGILGEELVMNYEREKLRLLKRDDLAHRVKWISKFDDSVGYDIESFDINSEGKVVNLKIEVKTTVLKVDSEFFVSVNELKKSKQFKDSYCVYRIYDVNSEHPKFYKAYGAFEDNFNLDPSTYRAIYKYKEA